MLLQSCCWAVETWTTASLMRGFTSIFCMLNAVTIYVVWKANRIKTFETYHQLKSTHKEAVQENLWNRPCQSYRKYCYTTAIAPMSSLEYVIFTQDISFTSNCRTQCSYNTCVLAGKKAKKHHRHIIVFSYNNRYHWWFSSNAFLCSWKYFTRSQHSKSLLNILD